MSRKVLNAGSWLTSGDCSASSVEGTLWMALAKSTTASVSVVRYLHELPGGVLLLAGARDADDGAGDVALAVAVRLVVGHRERRDAEVRSPARRPRSCRPATRRRSPSRPGRSGTGSWRPTRHRTWSGTSPACRSRRACRPGPSATQHGLREGRVGRRRWTCPSSSKYVGDHCAAKCVDRRLVAVVVRHEAELRSSCRPSLLVSFTASASNSDMVFGGSVMPAAANASLL